MAESRVINIRDFRRPGTTWARYDLPPDAVRIDRRSRWGNPYKMLAEAERAKVIDLFRGYAERMLALNPAWLDPLRGKRLACWCAPKACHGNVLVELLDRG